MQQISLVSGEKRKNSVVRADQEKPCLVKVMKDLSINDSAGETKKSSRAEQTKSKEERHRGTTQTLVCTLTNRRDEMKKDNVWLNKSLYCDSILLYAYN